VRVIQLLVVIALVGCTSGDNDAVDHTSAPAPRLAETASLPTDVPERTDEPQPTEADVSVQYPIEYLHGVSSDEPTGVQIVAGSFLIDVDTGSARHIAGLPELDELNFWSMAAADRAVISATCTGCTNPHVFVLDRASESVVPIGAGFAAAAPDGVWLTNYASPTSCTMSKVAFDGSTIRPAEPMDCKSSIRGESEIGLVVRRSDIEPTHALLSAVDLSVIADLTGFNSVVGARVLTKGGKEFGLFDPLTGEGVEFEAPTSIGTPSAGQLNPDGTLVAVAFGHPAWPGPRQRLDVWILHLDTLTWSHLPSMPVAAALKATSYQWLADGRFAIFGDFDHLGSALATWRPGDPQLVVHPLAVATSPGAAMWCTLGAECADEP